ncbi:MAG: hypothetical protein AB7R77_06025 [Ilumatobacteraceae bacterium]
MTCTCRWQDSRPRAQRLSDTVHDVEAAGPLPTVEEIAAPMVQAFDALWQLGDRVQPLIWLSEFGEDRKQDAVRQTWALHDLVHHIADAVAVAAASNVDHDDRARITAAVRTVVETIAHAASLDNWALSGDIDNLLDWGKTNVAAS